MRQGVWYAKSNRVDVDRDLNTVGFGDQNMLFLDQASLPLKGTEKETVALRPKWSGLRSWSNGRVNGDIT